MDSVAVVRVHVVIETRRGVEDLGTVAHRREAKATVVCGWCPVNKPGGFHPRAFNKSTANTRLDTYFRAFALSSLSPLLESVLIPP